MNKKLINELIDQELEKANEKFPQFSSRHEAYGVLKEEYEELKAEIDDIGVGILEDYWELCKKHKPKDNISLGLVEKGYYSIYGDKQTEELLKNLEIAINCGIKELIQVCAMVKKAQILEKQEGK